MRGLAAGLLLTLVLLTGCMSGKTAPSAAPGDQGAGQGEYASEGYSSGSYAPAPAPDPAPAAQDEVELTVTLADYSFEPEELTIPLGARVTLTITNGGERKHDFAITGAYGIETEIIEPGASQVLTFTADKAGQFEIVCSLRGHKERGMVGTLIVK